MVLGPFAETKGPRLPGRNPARSPPNFAIQRKQLEVICNDYILKKLEPPEWHESIGHEFNHNRKFFKTTIRWIRLHSDKKVSLVFG